MLSRSNRTQLVWSWRATTSKYLNDCTSVVRYSLGRNVSLSSDMLTVEMQTEVCHDGMALMEQARQSSHGGTEDASM